VTLKLGFLQCNTDKFDVDALLEAGEREILYLANQNAGKMLPGGVP
jgi:hypothetical protein